MKRSSKSQNSLGSQEPLVAEISFAERVQDIIKIEKRSLRKCLRENGSKKIVKRRSAQAVGAQEPQVKEQAQIGASAIDQAHLFFAGNFDNLHVSGLSNKNRISNQDKLDLEVVSQQPMTSSEISANVEESKFEANIVEEEKHSEDHLEEE